MEDYISKVSSGRSHRMKKYHHCQLQKYLEESKAHSKPTCFSPVKRDMMTTLQLIFLVFLVISEHLGQTTDSLSDLAKTN